MTVGKFQRALWSDIFTGRLKEEIPPILRSLCDAMIRSGTALVELDLSDNAFGPIGAEGIEKFLESPSAYSLEVLKLNNNGLGAGGKVIRTGLFLCIEIVSLFVRSPSSVRNSLRLMSYSRK
ncbi:unnamed protein product [Gongylonema pulchrum]|uniref:Ran gtpase-activating protein n=1 Tax=Gongylonema pulchrum TaxID=637853 RepID=A0A183DBY8_9BILA|nr:unnamed protein product [Gongylonema pulchrum]